MKHWNHVKRTRSNTAMDKLEPEVCSTEHFH